MWLDDIGEGIGSSTYRFYSLPVNCYSSNFVPIFGSNDNFVTIVYLVTTRIFNFVIRVDKDGFILTSSIYCHTNGWVKISIDGIINFIKNCFTQCSKSIYKNRISGWLKSSPSSRGVIFGIYGIFIN